MKTPLFPGSVRVLSTLIRFFLRRIFATRVATLAVLFLTPALRAQINFYPNLFNINISFGCHCTCECDTNSVDTNNPISAFLAANPVTNIASTAIMPAAGQVVPPHWTEYMSGTSPPGYGGSAITDYGPDGWTTTRSSTGSYGYTPFEPVNFNLNYPLNFNLLDYWFYADLLTPDAFSTSGDIPAQQPQDATLYQPYPWNVNLELQFADQEFYYLEQQLVVGYDPQLYSQPVETPVNIQETNSLVTVSLYCTNGGTLSLLNVSGFTLTATLLPGNIPAPLDQTVGWQGSTAFFTNWAWPLSILDTPGPNTLNGPAGSAGTVQAFLNLGTGSAYPMLPSGTIDNLPLLVRAERTYKLALTYYLNGDYIETLYVTNTGVMPPCTNVQFTFYTGICSITNPPPPPPCSNCYQLCYSTNIGTIDMMGAPDDPPGITIYAKGDNNTFPTYLTGSALATLPAPFELPVFMVNEPSANFTKYATESLGLNTSYEYFSSPWLSPIDEQCYAIINLTNDFVMCPGNPGIVQGIVSLCGPMDTNYYGGIAPLSVLQFATYTSGLPYDPATDPFGTGADPELLNICSIEATNGASAISPFNTGNGEGITEFDNSGSASPPDSYTGHYALQLAGLQSQPSVWDINDLHLVFGSPVNLDYHIYENTSPFHDVNLTCGGLVTNNFIHCFGLYTISVADTNFSPGAIPSALIYTQLISLQVTGSGPGGAYTVSSLNFDNVTFQHQTAYSNEVDIQLFLPEGTYQFSNPTVRTAGGSYLVLNETNTFTVTCACGTNNCQPTNSISLNTGFDQNLGTVYATGAADAFWTVTGEPPGTGGTVPRPATAIVPDFYWLPAMADSQWISAYSTDDDNTNGEYDFETYFCLEPGATNLNLSVSLRVDDNATVSLNGHQFLQTPPLYSFQMATPTSGGGASIPPSWFVTGRNVLHVSVTNVDGVAMGLNLTGALSGFGMTVDNPDCCQPLSGISGQKFYDFAGSGVRNYMDPPLAGWTMQISGPTGTYTTQTDPNGYYYFQNLPPGTYTVAEVQQPGWTQTTPAGGSYTITLATAQQVNAQDFGNTHSNTGCIDILCPSNIIANCIGGGAMVTFNVIATNMCTNILVKVYCTPASGTFFQEGVTTVHCTAVDSLGDYSTNCSFTVTVQDTNAPIFSGLTNKTVDCGTNWQFDMPTVSDPCGCTNFILTGLTPVTNSGCPQIITKTWVATNFCNGLGATATQTVTNTCCTNGGCVPEPIILFNTGVNASGALLAGGSVDPHYLLTLGGTQAVVVNAPIPGAWVPNDAVSQWISPFANGGNTPGTFIYQVSFDVSCTNDLVISGQCAMDDEGAIYVDSLTNLPVLSIPTTAQPFSTWHPFTINGGLAPGAHTLLFVVTNFESVTGLRVELSGSSCCSSNQTNPCCQNCTAPYPITFTNLVSPGYNYLADNLCQGSNNSVNDILTNLPSGTTLSVWNTATQSFSDPLFYLDAADAAPSPAGWYDDNFNPSSLTLSPGEGFVLDNSGPSFTLVIQGCDPGCTPPCTPSTNGASLVGLLGIGPATWTNLFSCPPPCGAEMQIWNGTAYDTYNYTNGNWIPLLPVLPPGGSALVSLHPCCSLTVTCPSNLVVSACTNEPVTFPEPQVIDTCCTNWTAMFDPTNGSSFAPGTNLVTCVVIDGCGNSSSCNFNVIVQCSGTAGSGGSAVLTVGVSNQVLNLNWVPNYFTNWQLEDSTDLVHWVFSGLTSRPPVFVNLTKSQPLLFYRLMYETNHP